MLGSLAVASGRYRMEIRNDLQFGRLLPVLPDPLGVSRLRIAPGGELNGWVSGCVVRGVEAPGVGGVRRSKDVFDPVFAQIQAASSLGQSVAIRAL